MKASVLCHCKLLGRGEMSTVVVSEEVRCFEVCAHGYLSGHFVPAFRQQEMMKAFGGVWSWPIIGSLAETGSEVDAL